MITLGIDSAVKTGLAVIDDWKVLESYTFSGGKKKEYFCEVDRWTPYVTEICALITHYDPDLIVIEGYGFGNAFTLATLVELGSIIRVGIRNHAGAGSTPIVSIAPTCLKKFVTGKGNAKKDMMLLEIFKRWGLEAKDDNEADAVGLALMGQALLDEEGCSLPKMHLSALDVVKLRYESQLSGILTKQ